MIIGTGREVPDTAYQQIELEYHSMFRYTTRWFLLSAILGAVFGSTKSSYYGGP